MVLGQHGWAATKTSKGDKGLNWGVDILQSCHSLSRDCRARSNLGCATPGSQQSHSGHLGFTWVEVFFPMLRTRALLGCGGASGVKCLCEREDLSSDPQNRVCSPVLVTPGLGGWKRKASGARWPASYSPWYTLGRGVLLPRTKGTASMQQCWGCLWLP